jgi:hypothetical protein
MVVPYTQFQNRLGEGTVPFYYEDSAKLGHSPAVLKLPPWKIENVA